MTTRRSRAPLLRRIIRTLGPGLVTGAADDDPSGIFTYSQSGAQFGLGQLWTVLFMLPLLICVQEMSTRIAIVTNQGLATVIRKHYSKLWLYGIAGLLVVTNTINLGADLGAMAESSRLILDLPYLPYVLIFGVAGLLLEVLVPYRRYARPISSCLQYRSLRTLRQGALPPRAGKECSGQPLFRTFISISSS